MFSWCIVGGFKIVVPLMGKEKFELVLLFEPPEIRSKETYLVDLLVYLEISR